MFDLLKMCENILKRPIENKYIVNWTNGTANENCKTRVHNHKIFVDEKGAYIIKRDCKVYLDYENSDFN